MNNQKSSSEDTHANPIDWFLNETQEDEISKQESVQQDAFDVNADDLAHAPKRTSQEHSLDDTHASLTQSSFDKNDLLAAAENA